MNNEERQIEEVLKVKTYQVGSQELESLLQAGYPKMNKQRAEDVIKARKDNPSACGYSLDDQMQAEAFLAALKSKPVAIDTDRAWVRTD